MWATGWGAKNPKHPFGCLYPLKVQARCSDHRSQVSGLFV